MSTEDQNTAAPKGDGKADAVAAVAIVAVFVTAVLFWVSNQSF